MHEQVKSELGVKVAAALRDAEVNLVAPPRGPDVKIENIVAHPDVQSVVGAARESAQIPDKKVAKEGSAGEK